MATRQMTVSLSLVVKTTDEWAAVSTVIKAGMPVVEKTDVGYMMKVGDGVNTFADLPYVGGPVTDLTKEMIIDTLEYTPLDAAKAGVAGGVATLDENGYIPSTQIPDAVDEIIEIITIDDAPQKARQERSMSLSIPASATDGAAQHIRRSPSPLPLRHRKTTATSRLTALM